MFKSYLMLYIFYFTYLFYLYIIIFDKTRKIYG